MRARYQREQSAVVSLSLSLSLLKVRRKQARLEMALNLIRHLRQPQDQKDEYIEEGRKKETTMSYDNV